LTNQSTNAVGAVQYSWMLGNGIVFSNKDVTYSFPRAGVYNVKVVVSSSLVCKDSVEFTLTVYQNAVAGFSAENVCINLPMQAINNTADTMNSPVHYTWNFGNGQTSSFRNPPAQVYTQPGTYTVSLSVYTDQCPSPLNTMMKNIVIDKPRSALNYPVEYAVINYPLQLQARQFGAGATWKPAAWLNETETYSPVFTGPADQLYTIEIKTVSGCVTVDTQMVKAITKAEVFVPTAFTPNGDGLNDYLRPVVFGVKEIIYFRVFNRWGQLVYHSKDIQPGWDGRIIGNIQTSQVFVWMVQGKGVDGSIITKKGTVTLVR
jgi:gliding motility-associated-like protein